MARHTDRIDDMLARARKFTPEEVRAWHQSEVAKHGMVAAFKTTPEKFAEYLNRRAEADERAKKGMVQ